MSRIFSRKIDIRLQRNSTIAVLKGIVGEANADIWRVTLKNGEEDFDLTGWSSYMQLVRKDGTIQVDATIAGNVIEVMFPQASYVYIDKMRALLWIVNATSGTEIVVDELDLDVVKGAVGNVIDPGTVVVVPTLNALLAELDGMRALESNIVAAETERSAFYSGFNTQLANILSGTAFSDGLFAAAKMAFMSVNRAKNRFNPALQSSGQLIQNTGVLDTSISTSFTSDYMEILPGLTKIVPSIGSTRQINYARMCFYNASKVFISGYFSGTTAKDVPTNAVYVRVSWTVSGTTYPMVEMNTNGVNTAYAAYYDTIYTLNSSYVPSIDGLKIALTDVDGHYTTKTAEGAAQQAGREIRALEIVARKGSSDISITPWTVGNISLANGSDITATNRIRCAYQKFSCDCLVLTPETGYKIAWREYSAISPMTYIGGGADWITAETLLTINPDHYYRFVVSDTVDGTASSGYADHVKLTEVYTNLQSIPHKADSMAVRNGYTTDGNAKALWAQGTISAQAETLGQNSDSATYFTKRIRSSLLTGANIDAVACNDGYVIQSVFRYDNSGTCLDYLTIGGSLYTNFDDTYKYRIVVRRSDDGTISPADYANVGILSGALEYGNGYQGYSDGLIPFQVSVNAALDNYLSTDSGVADSESLVNVNCYLRLPTTYNRAGVSIPLVLVCQGSSTDADDVLSVTMADLVTAGFAVFSVSSAWAAAYDASDAQAEYTYDSRQPVAIRKAYDYIISHYNVTRDILVFGYSMGGGTAVNFINHCPGIVRACALWFPRLNLTDWTIGGVTYQGVFSKYAVDAAYFCNMFGFEVPGVVEEDKIRGYDAYRTRNYKDGDGLRATIFPVPIKIWQGSIDTTVQPQMTQEYYAQLLRGGSVAELRMVTGVGHDSGNATMHAETILWIKRVFNMP